MNEFAGEGTATRQRPLRVLPSAAVGVRNGSSRCTLQGHGLNDEMRQLIRHELWIEGLYRADSAYVLAGDLTIDVTASLAQLRSAPTKALASAIHLAA